MGFIYRWGENHPKVVKSVFFFYDENNLKTPVSDRKLVFPQ